MFAINAVTGISGWIQKEEMHWLDNASVPSRFFLGLRGAGTVSEAGEAKLFAGASRTLDEVVIIASSGQPQAFPCPVARTYILSREQSLRLVLGRQILHFPLTKRLDRKRVDRESRTASGTLLPHGFKASRTG
jgi:hypothetical protein